MFLAAQAAVAFIRKGTDMLHAGRVEIERTKKSIEQGIDDAKAIGKEVIGLWGWFKGLFQSSEPTPSKPTESVAQKKNAADKKTYSELESKLIVDIGDRLGVFFDAQQQIELYYQTLEEDSKNKFDPSKNTAKNATQRVLIELQMEQLNVEIRETMVYAPPILKDLYSRFLVMHAKIEREQEWARFEMMRRARQARWEQEQKEIRFIELISGVVAVMFISMFFGWIMWQIRNLSGLS
jgi:hypothetical protein